MCTTTEKLSWLDNHQERKKCCNLKNVHFEKCPNIKKHNFALMSTFYNFNLKIEISWTKKVVKSILETWNVNDVIVYVWFIYFRIKKKKNMQ